MGVEQKNKQTTTTTGKQKQASKVRVAKQNGAYLVKSGVMTTLMKLRTGRKAIFQKYDSINMAYKEFYTSNVRLLPKIVMKLFIKDF